MAKGSLGSACTEVQRQLSVVVNANTHLHNGKINGASWGINLHRVRPACLLLDGPFGGGAPESK